MTTTLLLTGLLCLAPAPPAPPVSPATAPAPPPTTAPAAAFQGVHIAATDGLIVTADLYVVHPTTAPFIVLCHQAGWSRGEYREIAPKLNALGFNCIAIDQRSGKAVNDVRNETAQQAALHEKSTEFTDAIPDIEGTIAWVRSRYARGDLLLWGSSYSAALALKIAGDNPDAVNGVLAFAPGEYFARFGESDDYITRSAKNIKAPSFITSAKNEKKNWWSIHEAIPGDAKQYYLPKTAGQHGSRALWDKFDDNEGYWVALKHFLAPFVVNALPPQS